MRQISRHRSVFAACVMIGVVPLTHDFSRSGKSWMRAKQGHDTANSQPPLSPEHRWSSTLVSVREDLEYDQ
jgi:hypothetical protein